MLRDKRANRYLNLDVPEYFSDRLMTSTLTAVSLLNHFSVVDLYNDGSVGTSLYLYDFNVVGQANTGITISPFKGNAGGAGTPAIALNPSLPQREGSLFTGTVLSVPGNGYLFTIGSQGTYQWAHEWPIAEIIPGWSLRFVFNALSTGFTWSGLWIVEPIS